MPPGKSLFSFSDSFCYSSSYFFVLKLKLSRFTSLSKAALIYFSSRYSYRLKNGPIIVSINKKLTTGLTWLAQNNIILFRIRAQSILCWKKWSLLSNTNRRMNMINIKNTRTMMSVRRSEIKTQVNCLKFYTYCGSRLCLQRHKQGNGRQGIQTL